MASRYRWRQRLLGSLQGQLQLATYLVVFLGFTGASSVGLLIGQRNLLANDQQLARQSIALCDKAIRGLQDDPARLEQELLFHSNANTSLWIEDKTGTLLRPRIHRSLSEAAIQTAMATNPGREPGLQRTVDFGNERLLTELVKQLPDGSHLMDGPTGQLQPSGPEQLSGVDDHGVGQLPGHHLAERELGGAAGCAAIGSTQCR